MDNLLGADTSDLEGLAEELGEPRYRGRQIAEWIYKRGAQSISNMTNLPKEVRRKLEANSSLSRSKIRSRTASPDGTTKFLLEFSDEECVESVLIPYPDRVTVCVSTQVGCAIGCVFCATAETGFTRNLTAGEIVDQVLTLQQEAGRRITNVVYMGMGEPLLNYDAVLRSIRLLTNEVGISMRKITVSTVGITPRIRQLQAENLQISLAVSLHAPDDALRRILIPLAEKYKLTDLIAACRDYAQNTGRRVTYEYMLIAGINDRVEQARKLASLLAGSLANVNLIPYNAVTGKGYKRPSPAVVHAFREVLESAGIETTQRFQRGHTVAAACGQLRARPSEKLEYPGAGSG